MKYFALNPYKIYITDHVLNLLSSYKQLRSKTHESGGILLGQIKDDCIYILKASTPSKEDKSSRTTFDRSLQKAQIIIDYEFENSNQKTIYLGEWHTHPENFPKPSKIDIKMIISQLKENKLNEPFVICIIQGRKGIYIGKAENGKMSGIVVKDSELSNDTKT